MKRFYPFTVLCVPRVEKWLKEQSLKGYRLVKVKGWRFTFVKAKPKERQYFVYKDTIEKKDNFLNELFMAKRLYGSRNSELNKECYTVFEIDDKRLDNDFYSLILSRRAHYVKHYKKMLIWFSVFFAVFTAGAVFEVAIAPFALASFVAMMYPIVSLLILKKRK